MLWLSQLYPKVEGENHSLFKETISLLVDGPG